MSGNQVVLVESLKVGDTFWSGKNILCVVSVNQSGVSVQKIEATSSAAKFSISFYSSDSDDLMARVRIATAEDCKKRFEENEQKKTVVRRKFTANFPG